MSDGSQACEYSGHAAVTCVTRCVVPRYGWFLVTLGDRLVLMWTPIARRQLKACSNADSFDAVEDGRTCFALIRELFINATSPRVKLTIGA